MPSHRRTSREIEIKLPVADLPALIRDLRRLGAKPRGRVFERNTLYDTPESDFRRSGCLLRLRIEAPAPSASFGGGPWRAILTFKTPARDAAARSPRPAPSAYKEKLERERAIQDPGRWPAILRSLSFRPGFRYEKYRTTLRLSGLQLDLDETPIGAFLELEGAPKAIDRVARALRFSPRDYIRGTYGDLYAADCRRRGSFPRNMVFPA